MKRTCIFTITIFIAITFTAKLRGQVTIGSGISPNSGALLDLKSQEPDAVNNVTADRGIVIPRVLLTDINSLVDIDKQNTNRPDPIKHIGLIVYNLNKDLDPALPGESDGLYSWTGTKWQLMTNASNPFNKIATNYPAKANTDDVYLTGKMNIGTSSSDANALLELQSNNKGFLPPRLALTSTNLPDPLSAHQAGMIVYNTATAGSLPNNVVPGLYVNDGTSWKQLNSSVQKSASYFGQVDYGDILGQFGSRPVKGFILSATKSSVSGGDDLLVVHNLNFTENVANQHISVTILSDAKVPSYGQMNADNDLYQPVVHDVTANSFRVFFQESSGSVQNIRMMIQLTKY